MEMLIIPNETTTDGNPDRLLPGSRAAAPIAKSPSNQSRKIPQEEWGGGDGGYQLGHHDEVKSTHIHSGSANLDQQRLKGGPVRFAGHASRTPAPALLFEAELTDEAVHIPAQEA